MKAQTKETAMHAFIANCNEVDRLLAMLRSMSCNHFGTHPDNVTWGDAASVSVVADKLHEALAHYGVEV